MQLLRDLYQNRTILAQLAVYDLKHDYLGTWFGFLWAFVHPLLSAAILYAVFSHGFRGGSYFLWLLAGLFAWQYVSLCIRGGSMSIVQNSFLVRKLRFRVEFLPFVKVISASILHTAFVLILLVAVIADGRSAGLHNFQLLYYWAAGTLFALSVSLLAAGAMVFIRDLAGVVEVMLQLLFLATPIFWQDSLLPAGWLVWLRLNPLYYVVNGYRQSTLEPAYFWNDPVAALSFWAPVVLLFIAGLLVFRRLRPVFADYI